MAPRIVREMVAYYDRHETIHCDGFYPCFEPIGEPYVTESVISFEFIERTRSWLQISGESILGLDGNFGDVLLAKLNSSDYIQQPSSPGVLIYNHDGKQIYPKTNNLDYVNNDI
jgi:hypothetical protein